MLPSRSFQTCPKNEYLATEIKNAEQTSQFTKWIRPVSESPSSDQIERTDHIFQQIYQDNVQEDWEKLLMVNPF